MLVSGEHKAFSIRSDAGVRNQLTCLSIVENR